MKPFPTLLCSRVKPFFSKQKNHLAGIYSPSPTCNWESRVQHGEIEAFSMQKCLWRRGQAGTKYKLSATFRDGKVRVQPQCVALLATSTIKASEAMPGVNVCWWNYPKNAWEQWLMSLLQSVCMYIYSMYILFWFFSVWSCSSIHRDPQRCSSKLKRSSEGEGLGRFWVVVVFFLPLITESRKGKAKKSDRRSRVRVVRSPSMPQCCLLSASHETAVCQPWRWCLCLLPPDWNRKTTAESWAGWSRMLLTDGDGEGLEK